MSEARNPMCYLDVLRREMMAPIQKRIAKHQLDAVVASLSADERRLLSVGQRLHIFMPEKKTKKKIRMGLFEAPVYIDSTYIDYAALDDASQSDMPAMKRLQSLGFVQYEGCDIVGRGEYGGLEWTWTRTEMGTQVADFLAGKTDEPRFEIKWVSDNEAELIDLRQR